MSTRADPLDSLRKRLFLEAEVEKHPLFTSLLSSALDRATEQRIALELFFAANGSPRFLSALVTRVEDEQLRRDLVEASFDEPGRMKPAASHVMTYDSLLRALGVSASLIDGYEPALPSLCYVRAMLDLAARQSIPEAIGALAVVAEIVARVSPITACFGTIPSSGHSLVALPNAHEPLDLSYADGLHDMAAHLGSGAVPSVLRGMALGMYYHTRFYADLLRERPAAPGDGPRRSRSARAVELPESGTTRIHSCVAPGSRCESEADRGNSDP